MCVCLLCLWTGPRWVILFFFAKNLYLVSRSRCFQSSPCVRFHNNSCSYITSFNLPSAFWCKWKHWTFKGFSSSWLPVPHTVLVKADVEQPTLVICCATIDNSYIIGFFKHLSTPYIWFNSYINITEFCCNREINHLSQTSQVINAKQKLDFTHYTYMLLPLGKCTLHKCVCICTILDLPNIDHHLYNSWFTWGFHPIRKRI